MKEAGIASRGADVNAVVSPSVGGPSHMRQSGSPCSDENPFDDNLRGSYRRSSALASGSLSIGGGSAVFGSPTAATGYMLGGAATRGADSTVGLAFPAPVSGPSAALGTARSVSSSTSSASSSRPIFRRPQDVVDEVGAGPQGPTGGLGAAGPAATGAGAAVVGGVVAHALFGSATAEGGASADAARASTSTREGSPTDEPLLAGGDAREQQRPSQRGASSLDHADREEHPNSEAPSSAITSGERASRIASNFVAGSGPEEAPSPDVGNVIEEARQQQGRGTDRGTISAAQEPDWGAAGTDAGDFGDSAFVLSGADFVDGSSGAVAVARGQSADHASCPDFDLEMKFAQFADDVENPDRGLRSVGSDGVVADGGAIPVPKQNDATEASPNKAADSVGGSQSSAAKDRRGDDSCAARDSSGALSEPGIADDGVVEPAPDHGYAPLGDGTGSFVEGPGYATISEDEDAAYFHEDNFSAAAELDPFS